MQAYETEQMPVFDPVKPDGIKPQVDDRIVSAVLVSGEWIPIVEGTFKYMIAQPKKDDPTKVLPYIMFDVPNNPMFGALAGKRIEVFPQSVGGYAYSASAE